MLDQWGKYTSWCCITQICLAILASLARPDITGVIAVIGLYAVHQRHLGTAHLYWAFLLLSLVMDLPWMGVAGKRIRDQELEGAETWVKNENHLVKYGLGLTVVQFIVKVISLLPALRYTLELKRGGTEPTDGGDNAHGSLYNSPPAQYPEAYGTQPYAGPGYPAPSYQE